MSVTRTQLSDGRTAMPLALEVTETVKVPASLPTETSEGFTSMRDFSTSMRVASTSSRVVPL